MHVAGVIIRNANDEILLLHRATEKLTRWEIPGGKIEPGETATAAAIREISEELVATVDLIREIGSNSCAESATQTIDYTWFLGIIRGPEPQIGEPNKFNALKHWPLNELTSGMLDLSAGTKGFLNDLTAGRFHL